MTTLEKRQRIIQKIEKMPEELLDDLEKLIEIIEIEIKNTDQEEDRMKRIEAIIKKDFQRYKKVFEALA